MLKKLDELEEHPAFYERTEEEVLLTPESILKPGKTFEEVNLVNKKIRIHIYIISFVIIIQLSSIYLSNG